ncbi:hypothetical protein CEP53_011902 [Fusarium sp. AF-6]|nr:hypothetical protein CEP53_011902 [Fusarium sp. AF-6]
MSLIHVSCLWANSDQATMSLSNGSGISETHGYLMWDDHYDLIIALLPAAYPHTPAVLSSTQSIIISTLSFSIAWVTNQPTTHVVVPCHHGEKALFTDFDLRHQQDEDETEARGGSEVESEVEEEEEEKEEVEVPTNFDRSMSDDMVVCGSEKTVSNYSNSEFWIEME